MRMVRPHYPGRPPIQKYGNGGFRFADMSHKGSILILPSGVHAWDVTSIERISTRDFAPIFSEIKDIELVLLGTGEAMAAMPEPVRAACEAAGVKVEAMSTGAAARTYNVLLAENRAPAAALIAIAGAPR